MWKFFTRVSADSRLIDLLVESNKEKNELRHQVEYWKNLARANSVQYVPPGPIKETLEGEKVEDSKDVTPRFASLSAMRARAEVAARAKAKVLRGERDAS